MGVLDIISGKSENRLKNSFKKIRAEMEDHLDTINENTNELNSLTGYIAELEEKIVKLGERLDDAELKISELSGKKSIPPHLQNIILTTREEEIFILLYSKKGNLLDYREISKALGITDEMAQKTTASLIAKGIPIIKKYFENKTFLVLDSDFRNLQAKENIVKIRRSKQ